MKFRILCFSLLCMIAISFTACSNNASDNDNVNNKPDSIAVPPISPTSIAGLRCADPYGEGLASNSQGAYFTVKQIVPMIVKAVLAGFHRKAD